MEWSRFCGQVPGVFVPKIRSWKSRGIRNGDKHRVEGLLMSKNAEGDVKEFAHDGAADGKIMEFSALELSDPRLQSFAPAPGDGRWQIKGFT